jgi:hypothetical protein
MPHSSPVRAKIVLGDGQAAGAGQRRSHPQYQAADWKMALQEQLTRKAGAQDKL